MMHSYGSNLLLLLDFICQLPLSAINGLSELRHHFPHLLLGLIR